VNRFLPPDCQELATLQTTPKGRNAATSSIVRQTEAAAALRASLAIELEERGAAATNDYRTAVAKQEQCCDRLGDPATQETFQCVDRYFQCDGASGRATEQSAQAQLDCLNDLGSPPP